MLLVLPAQSMALRHRLGQGNRQARRGDGEEEGVDVIRAVEIAVGLLGQYGDKRILKMAPIILTRMVLTVRIAAAP